MWPEVEDHPLVVGEQLPWEPDRASLDADTTWSGTPRFQRSVEVDDLPEPDRGIPDPEASTVVQLPRLTLDHPTVAGPCSNTASECLRHGPVAPEDVIAMIRRIRTPPVAEASKEAGQKRRRLRRSSFQ
jgi:hypothetical protein